MEPDSLTSLPEKSYRGRALTLSPGPATAVQSLLSAGRPHLPTGSAMKKLGALIALIALTGCMATQAAVDRVNVALTDLQGAVSDVREKADNPEVTQAELDAAIAGAVALGQDAVARAREIPEAIRADLEKAKETARGLTGLGPLGDGGAISGVLTLAAWFLRDRRKRMGMDPLQRKDVPTPPVAS